MANSPEDNFFERLSGMLDRTADTKHAKYIEGARERVGKILGPFVKNATAEDLRKRVLKQGEIIMRQHNLLEEHAKPPFGFATVLAFGAEDGDIRHVAIITNEGKMLGVLVSKQIQLDVGDTVTVSAKTGHIIDRSSDPQPGIIGTVRRIAGDFAVEVDCQGSVRSVLTGKFAHTLEAGDKVCLDPAMTIVKDRRGKEEAKYFFTGKTGIRWEDIGGQEKAKEDLREIIELPYKYPELYRFHGKKIPKGALLYGPPRCGKTLLAKAVATAIAEIHGGNGAKTAFLNIRGPELLDKYVGETERKLRNIFEMAKDHFNRYQYPPIVFFDEADALFKIRGSGKSSDVEDTIVGTFLPLLDGVEESKIIILLATNRPDRIDPAVIGDGRIDFKIMIRRPTKKSAVDIFKIHMKNSPFENSNEEMAEYAAEELFSPDLALYEIPMMNNGAMEVKKFTLGDMVDGGMIANIVERSTSLTLRRNISNTTKEKTTKTDVLRAIRAKFAEVMEMDHSDRDKVALREFVEDFKDSVLTDGIKKLKQATAV